MDESDFKLKARREIHDLPVKDLDLLHLIMRNIKENPTEPKYRRIKSRKVNDQIYSLMAMVGFVKKVYDFESHAILENGGSNNNDGNVDRVAMMLQLVEESQNSRERKKKEEAAVKEQLRKEKEKKKEIQQQLKLDYLERKADKERLELIKGRISPDESTHSLESPQPPPPQEKTDEDKKLD
ncbi:hypothetical protein MP638_003500 [Amoeboaphelidium occidentale]|nr:hypothetical protein MP638_003500 [Amoeboaphelidium occidentale]